MEGQRDGAMSKFRRQPPTRRAASPTAKWLVTGPTIASEIQYGRRTTYMLPVKPNHHRRRFHEGQRLSLKSYVGGSTLAHVTVTDAQRVQLGHVDYAAARELGHPYVDAFRAAWVAEHEPDHEGDALERFERRHAHKEVWLVRFALDRTDRGGLPAARSEEGYTDNPARAMGEEMPAVRGVDWEHHIDRPARDREAQRQAMIHADREAKSTSWRAGAARAAATMKGLDMRDEFRRLYRLEAQERHAEALEQLALIESRVYPRRAAA
jgi:hypothetical protein